MVEVSKVEDAPQVCDAAGVSHRHPDVIDELLADQLLAVPDRIEHLAHRDGSSRMLPDQTVAFLPLGWDGILQPEQPVLLDPPAKPARLAGGQTVVDVMEQVDLESKPLPDRGQHRGNDTQVSLRGPSRLCGQG